MKIFTNFIHWWEGSVRIGEFGGGGSRGQGEWFRIGGKEMVKEGGGLEEIGEGKEGGRRGKGQIIKLRVSIKGLNSSCYDRGGRREERC